MSSPQHMTNIKELVETGPIASGEARRTGGRAARMKKRMAAPEPLPAIHYGMAPVELMGPQDIAAVHAASLHILGSTGIEFRNEAALALMSAAGAKVDGTRVRIPAALLESLIAKAPSSFTLHGREASFGIGGSCGVFAPASGAPHATGRDGLRKDAAAEDFEALIKLTQMSPELHLTSPALCVPKGMGLPSRMAAMLRLSAKPFICQINSAEDATHALAMAELALGNKPGFLATIRCRSPLVYEAGPLDALLALARGGQPVILSSFAIAGASTPASMAGTLAQVNAETLAGIALAQLVKPGTPVMYGPQMMVVAMRSGAPMGATPEAAQFTLLFGQLARHYGLPFRATGFASGAKTADAQAGAEGALMMQAAIQAHAHVIEGAGALDAGQTIGFAKLLLDAAELGGWHKYARGPALDDMAEALSALEQVGPQGHFLGTSHTLKNYERVFHMPSMNDYGPFEQWEAEGSREAQTRAAEQSGWNLEGFSPPALPEGAEDRLAQYLARLSP